MVLTVENQRDERKKFTIGKAIRHGTMAGAVLWGAGQAIEARNNHPAEEFARNSSHSQTFSGDIGLAGIAARESRMDVARGPIFPMETFDQLSPLAYAAVLPTPGKRASKKGLLVLAGLSTILASCGGQGVMPTATVEAAPTQPPAITATAPTETPIPYVPPTEGVVPVTPSPEVSTVTLPDYTDFSSEGFLKPIKLSELKKAQSSGDMPAGFTLSAVEAFIQNAEDRLNGLPQKDRENATASVCYRSDLQRNTVLITRNNGDILWLFRGETPSFRPDYPSFATENTGALTYKWVRAGEGDVLCKFDGEFPIIATDTNTTDTHLSSVFQPAEAKFVAAPAVVETPTTAPTPTEAAPQEGDTYKDPVTGYEYTITVVRDSEGNEVYKGDFRPMTPIKIPTWDWTARWYGENGEIKSGKNVGNIDLYVDKNVPGADVITKITHVDVPEDYADYPPYLKTIYGKFTLNFGIGKDFKALFEGLQAGTLAQPFKVGSQEYTWYPSPDHGVIEYVLPYDAATMTEANGFNTWTDVPNTNEFVSKFVGIDPKGNMIWVMVSKTPLNELEDWEIRTMLNYPVATVLDSVNSDVSKKGDGPFLQSVVDDSAETNPPYTIIER